MEVRCAFFKCFLSKSNYNNNLKTIQSKCWMIQKQYFQNDLQRHYDFAKLNYLHIFCSKIFYSFCFLSISVFFNCLRFCFIFFCFIYLLDFHIPITRSTLIQKNQITCKLINDTKKNKNFLINFSIIWYYFGTPICCSESNSVWLDVQQHPKYMLSRAIVPNHCCVFILYRKCFSQMTFYHLHNIIFRSIKEGTTDQKSYKCRKLKWLFVVKYINKTFVPNNIDQATKNPWEMFLWNIGRDGIEVFICSRLF